MSNRNLAIILALFGVVFIAFNTLFVVKETERAVMLKFGRVVEADLAPGLHLKVPFVNTVAKFDARLLTLDAQPQRFLTVEKKAVIVDSYAKWRISDVSKYYTATNGEELRAHSLLAQRINTGLRNEFGERTMHEVISGERDQLMVDLVQSLDVLTESEFGIELVDVRVKRIDLPEQVSQSVFNRMTSEREREAREHRSKGKELAEGIRAAADRDKVVIESDAYRDAELIRGEGDAESAAIYASAYKQDPEFYSFMRSLQAYRESFANKGDIMLVEPDSEFFRYLKNSKGK
ncbi:MAG TPA: protease modulator HflC [Pseudomonadales bacterium]|nr:protease modulator HflC [Pseudomonadales bacterium]